MELVAQYSKRDIPELNCELPSIFWVNNINKSEKCFVLILQLPFLRDVDIMNNNNTTQ